MRRNQTSHEEVLEEDYQKATKVDGRTLTVGSDREEEVAAGLDDEEAQNVFVGVES